MCAYAPRVVSCRSMLKGRGGVDRSLKHFDLPNALEQATSKQLLRGAFSGNLDLVKKSVAELVKAGASLDVKDKVGGHVWW